jgi:hypothetical protein
MLHPGRRAGVANRFSLLAKGAEPGCPYRALRRAMSVPLPVAMVLLLAATVAVAPPAPMKLLVRCAIVGAARVWDMTALHAGDARPARRAAAVGVRYRLRARARRLLSVRRPC